MWPPSESEFDIPALGHQCVNSRLVFYTDSNYRVPHAGQKANGAVERPTSDIFLISRGLFEAKRILRFRGQGGGSKKKKENAQA